MTVTKMATHTAGVMNWDKTAQEARDRIGQWLIDQVDVKFNGILVVMWQRPKAKDLGNGMKLYMPDKVLEEDIYQGNSGMVLKMGRTAYLSDETVTYDDADRVAVGDWVLLRRGEGMSLKLNGEPCILLSGERGIKAKLPTPDVVY